MKLKELNPKYNAIEALPTRRRDGNDFAYTMQNMELLKLKEAVKKYGDCEVLSIRDYDETKTTSVILLVGEEENE